MLSNLIKRFLSLLGGSVGMTLVTFIYTPFLVRLLSPPEYGDYAFMTSVLSIAVLVSGVGIPDGIRKFLSQKSSEDYQNGVFGFYCRLSIATSIVAISILLISVGTGFISSVLGPRYNAYFLVFGCILMAKLAFEIIRSALMAYEKEKITEPLRVFEFIVFALAATVFITNGYGTVGALLGLFFGSLFAGMIGAYYLQNRHDLTDVKAPRPKSHSKKKLLSYNSLILANVLFSTLLLNFDLILLTLFAGSDLTAYYKAALSLVHMLWIGPVAVQTLLRYTSANLWLNNKHEQISSIAGQASRFSLLLTALMGVGLGALASEFVPLYFGQEYQRAVRPLLVLLPGAIAYAVARPISGIEMGQDKPLLPVFATAAATIINLVLNVIFIPSFGMTGAAFATSLSYGAMVLFHYLTARNANIQPFKNLRPTRVTFVVIVTTVAIFGLSSVESGIYTIILTAVGGSAVFISSVILTGAVDLDEIRSFGS